MKITGNDKLAAYVLLAMHGYNREEIKDIIKKVESDMENKEDAK